jgi:hypothetical protein
MKASAGAGGAHRPSTLPEEVPVLHRRAAGWFTRHGQVVNAIRHTQAAGDWADAARLLVLDNQAADTVPFPVTWRKMPLTGRSPRRSCS